MIAASVVSPPVGPEVSGDHASPGSVRVRLGAASGRGEAGDSPFWTGKSFSPQGGGPRVHVISPHMAEGNDVDRELTSEE